MPVALVQKVGQRQRLAITARMRETLRILRLSHTDLEAFVAAQVDDNPFLEWPDTPRVAEWRAMASGDADRMARIPAHAPTVRERLLRDLALSLEDATDRRVGAMLVDGLDDAGRLGVDVSVLARRAGVAPARVEAVRQRMMRLDPVGVGARSLAECLEVQLRERGRYDPAMEALLAHLPLLARRDMARLRAACGVDADDLADMIDELRRLNPRPGEDDSAPPPSARLPDLVVMRLTGGGWHVMAGDEGRTAASLNTTLLDRCRVQPAREGEDAQARMAEWISNARWLTHTLQRRKRSLLLVGQHIMFRQEAFLEQGPQGLRPLSMKRIAQDVRLHESTVSRLVANKHIVTPCGLYPLKFFFTAALGAEDGTTRAAAAARAHVSRLVQNETAGSVLSDAGIVAALGQCGFSVSRRTIVKYRRMLGIPSSFQRRRDYGMNRGR